jgi:ERCC4-type nuclease
MLSIDDRENTQHPDIEQLLNEGVKPQDIIPVNIARMDSADYGFLDKLTLSTGIERCEIGNFVQKMRDGELESQLIRCSEQYHNVILLIEGVFTSFNGLLATYRGGENGFYRSKIYPSVRYNSVMSLLIRLSELGIEVLQTSNFRDTIATIRILYEQRRKEEPEHSFFIKTRAIHIPTKLTKNPAVPRLMALCPRLSETTAIQLINTYGSIWGIVTSPEKDVLRTDGMGKTLLKRLKENIGVDNETS